MPRLSRNKAASTGGPGYHIPPGIAEQQQSGHDTHWMYDQPPKAAAASLVYPSPGKPPLVTPSASSDAADRAGGSLGIAFVAGTAVALLGGLLWAAVVIETHIDFGFLAWFVGAATGATVFFVSGAPLPAGARVLAGLLAAAGLIVGKYVIFVHVVNTVLASVPTHRGLSVSYFDSRVMGYFIHHFSTVVRPIYALWFLIALAAAVASAGGRRWRRRR